MTMAMPCTIRLATEAEAGGVAFCVCKAFIDYIPQIGKQPQPMLDDYAALIGLNKVYVAITDGVVAGVLVLDMTDEGFCLDTIAVDPQSHGTGLGRQLIAFAEQQAKDNGFDSLYLSTNRVMERTQQIYLHLGFAEYDQRTVNGYQRIYMRKYISA